MGVKSKIRSMQRGAQKRDRTIHPKESTYHLKDPHLRDEDLIHLGGPERFKTLAAEYSPIVRALAKNDFRKPADVTAALNKQGKRTPSGHFWTPRLVWFLLREIYKDKPKSRNKQPTISVTPVIADKGGKQPEKPARRYSPEQIQRNREKAQIHKVALSDEELKRRLQALAEHFR